MKETFCRYQFLWGALLVAAAVFLVNHRAPVMTPPAYAAASDVQGSPNVTVAAVPVWNSDNTVKMLVVRADGSTAVVPLPTNVVMFPPAYPTAQAEYDSQGNRTFYYVTAVGSDRNMYFSDSLVGTNLLHWHKIYNGFFDPIP